MRRSCLLFVSMCLMQGLSCVSIVLCEGGLALKSVVLSLVSSYGLRHVVWLTTMLLILVSELWMVLMSVSLLPVMMMSFGCLCPR